MFTKKKNTMQGTFVNLCYTMENHAIATMMTYLGPRTTGWELKLTEGGGDTSSKNRLESLLIYIYLCVCVLSVCVSVCPGVSLQHSILNKSILG